MQQHQKEPYIHWWEWAAIVLSGLYLLDHVMKLLAVRHFFRRLAPPPPAADHWPSVTVLSPITRGVSNLPGALARRAALTYAGSVQHILICDAEAEALHCLCSEWQAAHPMLATQLMLVRGAHTPVATKIEKLTVGLPHATGDILLFVDDDVALRPETLQTLVPYLSEPNVGAVFGLACYTAWHNLPSSLMSAFVNSNALISYIPLSYLSEPFTITGHCFALRKSVFEAAGGFAEMAGRLDDDHELARRLRRLGLRVVQTPLIYDVENRLPTVADYLAQMKRWFVFPRQLMMPHLGWRDQITMAVSSLHLSFLPLLTLLAVWRRRPLSIGAWAASVAGFLLGNWLCERAYLLRRTPLQRRPLLLVSTLLAPVHILHALLSRNEILWRGQRLRIHQNGVGELVDG